MLDVCFQPAPLCAYAFVLVFANNSIVVTAFPNKSCLANQDAAKASEAVSAEAARTAAKEREEAQEAQQRAEQEMGNARMYTM